MTDKVQKIREEVEKRYNYWKEKESNSHSIESEIRMSECQHLLLMLDSQEEPVSEDLEEIAWNHADKKCHLDIAVFTSDEVKKEREKMQFTWQDLYDAVMFGAKWQKEKDSILPKVWNRENLDEFSYQTAYDLSNDWMKEIPTWDDVEIACKLGAKWQKEQIMAKAIDGEVLENYDGKAIKYDETILDEKLSDCKVFDKVKLFVFKEN